MTIGRALLLFGFWLWAFDRWHDLDQLQCATSQVMLERRSPPPWRDRSAPILAVLQGQSC